MALIVCPGCGKEISEKASKCISCGYVIKEEVKEEKKCLECGTILADDVTECPNCGCPVEKIEKIQKVEVQNVKISKKTKKAIVVGLITVAVLLVAGVSTFFYFKITNEKNAEAKAIEEYNKYIDNVETVRSKMLSSGADCEYVAGMIHDVWYNTIYKKSNSKTNKYTQNKFGSYHSDFNDSIAALMSDSSFKSKMTTIKNDKDSIDNMMKKLQNPPEGLQNCYNAVSDLYNCYSSFVSLATNPSGNLSSYTSSYNSTDSDFINKFDTLKTKIPEKKTVGD